MLRLNTKVLPPSLGFQLQHNKLALLSNSFYQQQDFSYKADEDSKCPYLWLTGGSEPRLMFRSGHTAKAEARGGWSRRLCRWRRTGAAVRLTAGPPLLTAASPPTCSPCYSRLAQANVFRGTFWCHQAQPLSDSGADAAKEPRRLGLSENTWGEFRHLCLTYLWSCVELYNVWVHYATEQATESSMPAGI